jgi:hypothetical protein
VGATIDKVDKEQNLAIYQGCLNKVGHLPVCKRRHDTKHNDTQPYDIQHNDTQHNDIQHNNK